MKYDFGGYATKNDLRCADGRVIRRDAFKECDGAEVPLVYQHVHTDPMNIIGHAVLENRADGVYAYCSLNNSESGKHMKEVVKHGDVKALSIYANRLKQQGSDVLHGIIREVSVVMAGANPGAKIENVSFAHADGFEYESEDDVIIHSGESIEFAQFAENEYTYVQHADNESSDDQNESDDETVADIYNTMNEKQQAVVDYMVTIVMEGGDPSEIIDESEQMQHADPDDETVQEIWDSLNEKQRLAAEYMIGMAAQESEEDVEESDEEMAQSIDLGDDYMYESVFNQNNKEETFTLTHADMETIVGTAKRTFNGSLKEAMIDFIQHNFEGIDSDDPADVLQHGIEQLDILFPEAKLGSANPELISRPMDWVSEVWNATKKSPFSRVKSIAADITADEARARGYIKGKQKKEEVVKLLKRKISPQTVYKLQKLDRDDVIDATELDVVAWLKQEMRMMLEEELSRAILIGDGRDESDESKISEEYIKPVYHDDDLYTIKAPVVITDDMDRLEKSDAIVDAAIENRKDYMGSGSPVMYASVETINMMLLARDKVGHRLYKTVTELADACRVSKIVEVPILEGATREDDDGNEFKLLALIVNLKDYTVGADKGGAVTLFDDFDINYNKYEYLIETRCSGALTKPYSAIALEIQTKETTPSTPSTPSTPTIEG